MVSYDCKGCEVHAGFFDDYRVIEAKVDAKISELIKKYPTARIVTIGHSLGGALSEIGGLRLRQKFGVPVDVHNFGCPRVGNAAMAKFISTRVDTLYRVVHHKDLVPHLPPENYYYHHTAFEVFFDAPMTSYTICSESGEDKKCSNQYAPDYSAADHDFYFIDLGTLKC
jgi:putative lipase involved disintegration of autophagic bodies